VGLRKGEVRYSNFLNKSARKRRQGRKGKTNTERSKGENEQIRIVFWNVAGIKNKENEFWKYLGEFDVVGMVETWVEEKGWEKLKKRMPREFERKCQYAERESKKGRAKGGIIMGVKKGLEEENGTEAKEERGFMERTVKRKQRKWRIVTIYSRSMKETKRIIEERVKEQEEGTLVIGGDFNARIGGKGRRIEEEQARIRESRYNGKYEKIITEELPKYLGRESRKERVIIARFRCGNEEREINIGMRIGLECAGCVEKKKETIEHLLNECVELGEGDESREEILNEDGRGIGMDEEG
jgi:exonuclease III